MIHKNVLGVRPSKTKTTEEKENLEMEENLNSGEMLKIPKTKHRRSKYVNVRLSDREMEQLLNTLEARNIHGVSISEKIRNMFQRDWELYVTRSN